MVNETRELMQIKNNSRKKKMFIFQLDWFLPWVTAQQGDSGMRASAEDGSVNCHSVKVPTITLAFYPSLWWFRLHFI